MSHSFAVQQAPVMGRFQPMVGDGALHPVIPPISLRESVTDELRFRQLVSHSEISRVLHLRREIRLPGSAAADAGFASLEKKETSWGG